MFVFDIRYAHQFPPVFSDDDYRWAEAKVIDLYFLPKVLFIWYNVPDTSFENFTQYYFLLTQFSKGLAID